MRLPTLYKRNNVGELLYWSIWTDSDGMSATINTEYGLKGTKKPQFSEQRINAGKNLGRSNETSVKKQARLEAKSKWKKQKQRGYVEDIKDAKKGKEDKAILGGIVPMTCHKFKDQEHKIEYPCDGQPKLDGHRDVAIIKNGRASLWTRGRKPVFSAPHIIEALEKIFKHKTLMLDGELYNHDFKDNFEKISSLIRSQTPKKDHKLIQFHIFDIINDKPWKKRKKELILLTPDFDKYDCFRMVKTLEIESKKDVERRIKRFLGMGYEGIILRNRSGKYKHGRSYDVQKHKVFDDAEFKCVGIKEGKGKLRGHVGAFWCVTKKGQKFKAKMEGQHKFLRKCFKNKKLWKGKMLTVRYQGMTAKNGVPRFPIAVRFREKGE